MPNDRLSVLTLNIWNRQGPWIERAPLIKKGLAALSADLVGLQEVLHHDSEPIDQALELAAGLGYYVAFAPAWHIGGGLQFGNAVLSRWPISKSESFALPNEAAQETRSLLYVRVESPFGSIPVFCTHLDWKFHHGFSRERQVTFIAERVHALAPTDEFPPIIMGDFNAAPDADEIRFLRGLATLNGRSAYFADCFGLCGEGPGFSYARSNKFARPLSCASPIGASITSSCAVPIASCAVSRMTARLAFDAPEGDIFPSDHYGVYAEIQAAPRSRT